MSFSYERYDRRQPSSSSSRRRTALGYWIPLAVTVTLATAGVVAYVWRERRAESEADDASSSDEHLGYGREQYYSGRQGRGHGGEEKGGRSGGGSGFMGGVVAGAKGEDERRYDEKRGDGSDDDDSIYGRVQGMMKRTPSPQQAMDFASKKVAAGVAAAGAVVGGALQSIREEGDDYGDHERWADEADVRKSVGGALGGRAARTPGSGARKRNVVIVVSAEAAVEHLQEAEEEEDAGYRSEHASVLSHLPPVDPSTTNLFVLIYAPTLGQSAPSSKDGGPASSLASSYSAVSAPPTPGEELTQLEAQPYGPPALGARDFEASRALFGRLHQDALRLVPRPAMAMPFATPTGCVHMLRHLAPDTVYIVEALAGQSGEVVEQIRGWVGQVVVVVGTDGGGLGGLVDTEDELSGREGGKERVRDGRWWQSGDIVGLGKGVEVVDGIKVGEDFERRVGGRE